MVEEIKSVGSQFVDDLYQILHYACRKALEDDIRFMESECYAYQELFEHFENVTDIFLAIRRVMDVYDDIIPELVGFAITKNIEDFDISFTLMNETLIGLRDKIDEQIKYNVMEYGDIDRKKG